MNSLVGSSKARLRNVDAMHPKSVSVVSALLLGSFCPGGGGVKSPPFYPKTIFNGPIKTIILMGVNRNRVNDSSVKVAY